MPSGDFRAFILHCFGATRHTDSGSDSPIHGWRNQRPIWVGRPELTAQADHNDVLSFANAVRRTPQYQQSNLRDATMLAWGFDANARTAADRLRQQEQIDLNFVRIDQVRIDHPKFREHIARRSTDRGDYTSFLTFVQPPVVQIGFRLLGGLSVAFDAGDTYIVNPEAEIVNVQWDFNHNDRTFNATPGFSFNRDRHKKPTLVATHRFNRAGKFRVACKVQDSKGGEGTIVIDVQVE